MNGDPKFWPFPTLPPGERTDAHRRHLAFLATAYAEGFRPFADGSDFGAAAPDGRGGNLIYRGHGGDRAERWEVSVGSDRGDGFSVLFLPFDVAADALLRWLRGGGEQAIRAATAAHCDPPHGRTRRDAHRSGAVTDGRAGGEVLSPRPEARQATQPRAGGERPSP